MGNHAASRPDALAYVARPAAPGRPVLVLHSWWGLTASFPDYADRLAASGFLAGCVDLYDGRVATTPDEVRALRSRPRREPMYRTMLRALAELRADPLADGRSPGLVGFSMGGHWALWLAQRADAAASGVVVYYAARAIGGGDPVPVLLHEAATDAFVSPTARRSMERSLDRHGWPYAKHAYPGTGHWFAESASDAYTPDAAALAFARTAAFLAEPGRLSAPAAG